MPMKNNFLLREEYFGSLLLNRQKVKYEVLNRWQTKALQLAPKQTREKLARILNTNNLTPKNYDESMDDEAVKAMNKEGPTLQELNDFLDIQTKNEVLANNQIQFDVTKIKRKLEYPMLSAPLLCFLELTNVCNMACSHCYNAEDRKKENSQLLTTNEMLVFIKQAKEIGLFYMKLQGGEAVLQSEWKRIAQSCIAQGIATTLYTGGYFKKREHVLEEIASIPFNEIRITFAGLEDLHNKFRPAKPVINGNGQPSYHEINKTLDYLLSRKANVKLNFVLGRRNMHQVETFVITMAKKSLKYNTPFDINFGPQRPFGEGFRCPGDPDGRNLMNAEDFFQVNCLIEKLRGRSEVQAAGMKLIVVFDIFSPKRQEKALPRDLIKDGCGLGKRGFSVSYEGEVGICSFMTSCKVLPSGGNIREKSIEDIWYESDLLRKGRIYTKQQCKECEYYTNPCQGICPAMALYSTGNWEKGDPGCFKHLL